MKRGYRGSITIYLALTFSIIIALIFTLVQDIRSQAARMSIECVVDLSLYSVFAEYHKELLEQYDLFFIDSGYGNVPNIENVSHHMKGYVDDNFTFELDNKGFFMCDFLKMETEQVKLCGYTRATDEDGQVFKRQAIAYMNDLIGVSYIQKWQKDMKIVEEKELLTRDVTAERNAIQQEIDSIEIPPEKISENEYREVPLENPADRVNASRNVGVLHLVIEDVQEISNEWADLSSYASHRKLQQGYGLLDREKPSGVEDLLYHEYILSKCSNYTNQMDKSKMKYQVEYILAGKNNDVENLKWVVNRLLLLREVANITYIYSDSTKVAEARLLALGLAAVAKNPKLIEPVKNSILFAWAYAESVYDVKQLLAGKTVPLIKTSESWHYSLMGMLNYEGELEDTTDLVGSKEMKDDSGTISENGMELSYKDYLRILLNTVSEKNSIFRMMDMVEMDIQKNTDNSNFRMDGCVDYIDVKVYGSSGYGTTMEIRRSYFYF